MFKELHNRYILVGQTPVPCEDMLQWAEWFGHADRHVALTRCWGPLCRVSTVFLGLDHNHMRMALAYAGEDVDDYEPLLFETMTFWWPGAYNSHQRRCGTWEQAEKLHAATVRVCRRWGALIYLWFAIREWTEGAWRDLEYWGERCEKKQRGIPLNHTERMVEQMARLRRSRWRYEWKQRLLSLWHDEETTREA